MSALRNSKSSLQEQQPLLIHSSAINRFLYPGTIVLLSIAGNHWLQTPKFEALQESLNEHTATLTTLSEKMDRIVGSQELLVLRQESLERAHLSFEQRMAEMQNLRVRG